jgi:adenosine deaminase
MLDMRSFIGNMPKAELHLHIEGAIQPTMLLEMAQRNGIDIPYKTEAELLAAQDYGHPHLANFLRHHYERVGVIRTGKDLYDISLAFLKRCQIENIRYVELMFDPQVHLDQGLTFEEVIEGLQEGCEEGYRLTAHCDVDQENSPQHIHQCIHLLGVERIDHGVNCLEDPDLVLEIKEKNICLTVCPTWRISDPGPRRVKRMRKMFDLGLSVTINTDDPEEFASRYLSNTMIEVQKTSDYSPEELLRFMRNAFIGSWLDAHRKQAY